MGNINTVTDLIEEALDVCITIEDKVRKINKLFQEFPDATKKKFKPDLKNFNKTVMGNVYSAYAFLDVSTKLLLGEVSADEVLSVWHDGAAYAFTKDVVEGVNIPQVPVNRLLKTILPFNCDEINPEYCNLVRSLKEDFKRIRELLDDIYELVSMSYPMIIRSRLERIKEIFGEEDGGEEKGKNYKGWESI